MTERSLLSNLWFIILYRSRLHKFFLKQKGAPIYSEDSLVFQFAYLFRYGDVSALIFLLYSFTLSVTV